MKTVQIIDHKFGFVNLIVDDADYEHVLALSKITLYLTVKGDVRCKVRGHGCSLAEELLGPAPVGLVIDHENRDKRDFRRSNLRIVNAHVQAANKGVRKDNKTGYKGVQQDRKTGRYFAALNLGPAGRYYSYGHLDPRMAALSYDVLVLQHQPYGVTNEKLGLL